MRRRPLRSPLFPYTTLFRSRVYNAGAGERRLGVSVLEFVGVVAGIAASRRSAVAEDAQDAHVVLDAGNPGGRAVLDHDLDLLDRSEEHTSELQSLTNLVCRL